MAHGKKRTGAFVVSFWHLVVCFTLRLVNMGNNEAFNIFVLIFIARRTHTQSLEPNDWITILIKNNQICLPSGQEDRPTFNVIQAIQDRISPVASYLKHSFNLTKHKSDSINWFLLAYLVGALEIKYCWRSFQTETEENRSHSNPLHCAGPLIFLCVR